MKNKITREQILVLKPLYDILFKKYGLKHNFTGNDFIITIHDSTMGVSFYKTFNTSGVALYALCKLGWMKQTVIRKDDNQKTIWSYKYKLQPVDFESDIDILTILI